MRATPIIALGLALCCPGVCVASATADDVVEALGIPAGDISSIAIELGDESMLGVTDALGYAAAANPPLGGMYTGIWDNVTSCEDDDMPPVESALGDAISIRVELTPPDGIHSFKFEFFFMSREYPEFVGSPFNDEFTVTQESAETNGNIVFDRDGNEISVNSALFGITDPSMLGGTGFDCGDRGGGTGWLTTNAPCIPGELFALTFRIADEADGRWDSIVLLDGFEWQEEELDGPEAATADVDGDGWDSEEDCDDENAAIHPGAAEDCENGLDDDCDGAIDGDDGDCGGDDDTAVDDDDDDTGDDDTDPGTGSLEDPPSGCSCSASPSRAATAAVLALLLLLLLRRR